TFEIVTPASQLPYELGIYLPENAAMALHSRDTDQGEKELVVQEISQTDQGSLMKLVIDQEQYYAQLYYNPFDTTAFRQFDFDLKFDQDIDSSYVVVQQNLAALNFNLNLKDVESMTDDYGFTYYRQAVNNLKAGDVFHVQFSYENPQHLNSTDVLQQRMADHPAFDQDSSAAASSVNQQNIKRGFIQGRYLVIIGLPVLLVLFFLFRKKLFHGTVIGEEAAIEADRYCTECGTKVEMKALYCGNCGKEINAS
ncbi:MAG: zinc ribbon domain-containing protein, partial [FCB group bacterium]|nr:zinc ribbon domain-containing protein [FCB group bacterium]